MTITKYDRFAIIPRRCDKCNRLFWLEGYNVTHKIVGVGACSLMWTKCKKCVESEEKQ